LRKALPQNQSNSVENGITRIAPSLCSFALPPVKPPMQFHRICAMLNHSGLAKFRIKLTLLQRSSYATHLIKGTL
jgi:hypothetical protein